MAMYMKDSDGNVQEVGFTNEVDRSKWKLLAETEITQEMIDEAGEEGITAIVMEFEPIKEWYGETWIRAGFGSTTSLNSSNGALVCGFGQNITQANGSGVGGAALVRSAGTYTPLYYQYANGINLFTKWHNNQPIGTIFMNYNYGSHSYPTTTNSTANGDSRSSIIGCKMLYIGSNTNKFKFPAGTKIKVYGRF